MHRGILNAPLWELTGTGRAAFAFDDTSFTIVRLSRASPATITGVRLQPHPGAWGATPAWSGER